MALNIGVQRLSNQPVDPQQQAEDQTLLSKLGSSALSGLGWLGSTLDKFFGGRAVRGVVNAALGGDTWREALSIIPGSDIVGLTNHDDTVYGRKILERAGVLDPGTPGFDSGDVAGFLADVMMDPAFYINPVGKTAAALALQKQGLLPKGMAEQARGFQHLESDLAKHLPVSSGMVQPAAIVPKEATIASREAQRLVEEATGQPLVPRYNRVAEQVPPVSPFNPAVGIPPAERALPAPLSYREALDQHIAGQNVPRNQRFPGDISPAGYRDLEILDDPWMGSLSMNPRQAVFKDIPTEAATPLRALATFGLPFMEPFGHAGTGPTAQWIMEKLGGLGEGLRGSAAIAPLRRIFSPSVENTGVPVVQNLISDVKQPIKVGLKAEMKGDAFELFNQLEPLLKKDPEGVNRWLTQAAEGKPVAQNIGEYMAELRTRDPQRFQQLVDSGGIWNLEDQFGKMQNIANDMRQTNAGFLQSDNVVGIPTAERPDYLQRLFNPLPPQGGFLQRLFGRAKQAVGGTHTSQIGRNELLEGFPGGTVQISDLINRTDQGLLNRPSLLGRERALTDAQAADLIREELTRTWGTPWQAPMPVPANMAAPGSASRDFLHQSRLEELAQQGLPGLAGRNLSNDSLALRQFATANPAFELTHLEQQLVAQGMHPSLAQEIAPQLRRQVGINEQAEKLAEHLKGWDARRAGWDPLTGIGDPTKAVPLFKEDPLLATITRGMKTVDTRASAEAFYKGLPGMAKPAADFGTKASVPIRKVIEDVGLTHPSDVINAATGKPELVAEQLAAKSLGVTVDDLKDIHLPKDAAEDMAKWLRGMTSPDEIKPILAAYDAATNLMKDWITLPFPAFHIRNIFSGLFNAWRDDGLSTRGMGNAKAVMQGKAPLPLPGMAANLTEAQVLDGTLKELYQHADTMGLGVGQTRDLSRGARVEAEAAARRLPGRVRPPDEQMLERLSGLAKPDTAFAANVQTTPLTDVLETLGMDTRNQQQALQGLLGTQNLANLRVPTSQLEEITSRSLGEMGSEWLGGWKGGDWNLLHAPGVSEEINTPLGQMLKVGQTSEDWLKISHYLEKRYQGFSAAEAAAAVKKYHFNYADVTQTERAFLKRLIPFYTFSSRSLPPLLEDLALRPAKLAETIRAATQGSHEEGTFVPPYIAEGTNIPLPGAPEGSARYLASLGLPIEDEFVKGLSSLAGGNVQRGLSSVLSGLNPIMRYPIEIATGKQMWTGRDLKDLRPSGLGTAFSLGDEELAGPISQILANTPASRFISSADKLMDSRTDAAQKVINLLTGSRITDVDLGKQANISARDAIREQLGKKPGVKSFDEIYVKPEDMSRLSPDELQLYLLYQRLQKQAQAANRAEKAGQGRIGIPAQR